MNQGQLSTSAALRAVSPTAGGFPAGIALELSRMSGATTFIETGTYQGGTTRWASDHFKKVYTIENAPELYEAHSARLRSLGNVEPILGDSRSLLGEILPNLSGQPAVFWLDGHWSGAETAGEHDECPLLGELSLISGRAGDIVFIDDARLYLSAPPHPHNASHWPTIAEVVAALSSGGRRPYIQVVDDVIIAIPDIPALRERLTGYAQDRAGVIWAIQAAKNQGGFAKFWRKIRARLGARE